MSAWTASGFPSNLAGRLHNGCLLQRAGFTLVAAQPSGRLEVPNAIRRRVLSFTDTGTEAFNWRFDRGGSLQPCQDLEAAVRPRRGLDGDLPRRGSRLRAALGNQPRVISASSAGTCLATKERDRWNSGLLELSSRRKLPEPAIGAGSNVGPMIGGGSNVGPMIGVSAPRIVTAITAVK